ncbi:hypothetical protein NE236_09645 [Actinoallomurus purpureus]|uniref:hypothetical protein n=1 Tax=Actinoallomurus purpureus TaxID=478114 RepID=UPI00209361EB|nr:hypothetical protein [Actinoallomurus purpureus]MCO6005248.1 hypothetical protein [Actinoallomurus purpureus]
MEGQAMTNPPVRLKALLRERHWQTHRTFTLEYDKAARKVDPSLVGRGPSRAQLHRWTSGEVKGLPYPDHCRVLEKMFPGWTAEQLFEHINDEQDAHEGIVIPASPNTSGTGLPVEASVATSPIHIRPYVEAAFDREHVAIDFFGFSGETLHGVIQEPLDKIRAGQLKPRNLTLRILVPDVSKPMAVPCRSEDLGDDPEFRQRASRIMLRHGQAILDAVEELADLGIVDSAKAEIRVHDCPPLFKLYVLNNEEVFFGFYPIRQHVVQIKGTPHPMFDPMGKETSLFRHTVHDGSAIGPQYVAQARQWFDTVWETISREFTG